MVTKLNPDEVGAWVDTVLLDPNRNKPVIGVTTHARTGHPWFPPEELESELQGTADVVLLETGEATWELGDALPPRLEVYGGAVRIWWPGLRRDSDPYEHRLFFIHSSNEAQAVFDSVLRTIRGATSAKQDDIVTATVQRIEGACVELEAGPRRGVLQFTDTPLPTLVRCLSVGLELQARVVRRRNGNLWDFSVRGLLPSPWECVVEQLAEEDVVTGRVRNLHHSGVIVEVLPGVPGFVHFTDLDWGEKLRREDIGDCVAPGELHPVKLVQLDHENRRLYLSIKHALPSISGPPRPLPTLVPGGAPFTWPGSETTTPTQPAVSDDTNALNEKLDAIADELEAANEDRGALRAQVRELKQELRSERDRRADLERKLAPELDPLSTERAFLLGVRLAYARLFDEGTRAKSPLMKMRVGRAFLESARKLGAGLEVEKLLDVCAQVAAGVAHEIDGRDVHPLHDGAPTAPIRTRADDNAKAWRCALQVKTPSARRLHWWSIPSKKGEDGATVEFACVGVHDQFAIPE